MTSHLRFAAVALLLASTAILLQARNRAEILPAHDPLASFPMKIGSWSGTDLEISRDIRDVLGAGEFLVRSYHDPSLEQPNVDLFLAYFPSQRSGDTLHSPKNCLPGFGWTPLRSSQIMLSLPGHEPFPANRYVVAKGNERRLVVYWYWAHNRGVASEYWAKFYLVLDSLRMNRSDGALVRLVTPILPDEHRGAADERLHAFAQDIGGSLNSYVPR